MQVQRQRAASKSATPSRTGQQASVACPSPPITMFTSPPRIFTQASSFRVSIGQVGPRLGGGGGQGTNVDGGGGGGGSTIGGTGVGQ